MRKVFRILFIVVIVLLICVSAIALYVKTALPNVGEAPNLKVAITPERVERGKYLANHVTACMDCHSQRDWNRFSGPLKPETFGGGGERFGKEMGFPGTLYSKNITPYGLHNWTDGELFRAIFCGENKDGYALFPLMGYPAFSKMTQEDAYSIIAYVRSLPVVHNDVPKRNLDFPVNFVVNTIPAKASLIASVDTSSAVAYGKYLVTIANCVECHSQVSKGSVIAGTEFGGGRNFDFPNDTHTHSANITFDNETGIGKWSEDDFVKRFKTYSDSSYHSQQQQESDFNTPMPWMVYTGMSAKDLGAIYQYLRTIKPIKNSVVHFTKG